MEFYRLSLRAPLRYRRIGADPFDIKGPTGPGNSGGGDALFCFALDSSQTLRIDPDPEQYLGPLLAAGLRRNHAGGCPPENQGEDPLELTAGSYYFTQVRKHLGRAACIEGAVELQKEGLWERLKLGSLLYLRRLFEDGSPVTQIFRPLEG
ncbi:MAG: hypothetical protein LBD31_03005 [Treponema sp.]|jgi:hypothetical protein|nr:hypothetical protein [Treponema sp.]